MNKKKLQNLFLLAISLMLLHVIEQWLFGFETAFADVEKIFVSFQGLFDNPDKAFLVLIATFSIVWMATIWFLLCGGRWQAMAPALFGVIFLLEIHHPIRALTAGGYYPGTRTGVLMFLLGIVLFKDAVTILRHG